MTTSLPTRGQQRILQFAGRANRRLRGHRDAVSGEVTYRIVELSQEPPPRDVMPVTPKMVASLQAAGWIEVALGTKTDWEYRVTQAGIAAANGPSRESNRLSPAEKGERQRAKERAQREERESSDRMNRFLDRD